MHMKEKRELKTEQIDLMEGWNLLFTYAKVIAMLPIEEWQRALAHAESVAPIIDPTLFREYLYSKKPEIIKKVMDAALQLKIAVLSVQPELKKMMEEDNASQTQKQETKSSS